MTLNIFANQAASIPLSQLDANFAEVANSSGVTFLQAGTGAVARTVQDKERDIVSVKDFGAVGDGVTDDTAAIQAAINYAVTTTLPKGVYFPAGNYKVTSTNALGPNANATGLRLFGDGPIASTITLTNTGATDFWLYDNGSASPSNPSLIHPTFENLGFIGSASGSGKCNGFRMYGSGGYPSQKFRFINCYGSFITIVLDCEGTTNASENYFSLCRFSNCGTLIYCNNPQAVNHMVVETDFESYTGNVFDFQNGGQLTMIGGSTVTSSANTTYVVNSVAPAGGITGNFNFVGVRAELNSATSKICNITGNNNSANYYFNGCNFRITTGGSRTSIILGGKGTERVKFTGCQISSSHTISWIEGTLNYYLANTAWPILEFEQCTGVTVASIAYTDTYSLGYTRIKDSADGTKDWEGGRLGYTAGGLPDNARNKVANGWIYYWSDVTFNPTGVPAGAIGSQIIIPVGATIKNIFVRKASRGGGGTANYRLEVVDGAGSAITVPTWGGGANQSTIANQGAEHNIVMTNLLKAVTDTTTGTITLRSVAGNQGSGVAALMIAGDYFFVEYI